MTVTKRNWKTPEATAFLAAVGMGVVTHLFGLVNILHNYDNMPQQPGGFGTGIPSGRWFLEVLDDICGWCGLNYNLPVVNGLIFIFCLALAAGFAVSTFGIKNQWTAAGIGMLFVVFPTITATMFFRYTVTVYGLGILLAVLAVWVLWKTERGEVALSAVCLALSMGIYQAYAPLTIAMFVLLLIRDSLDDQAEFKLILRKGFSALAALVLGVVVYFVCLKLLLLAYGTELNNYQGMDSIGRVSLAELPGLIKRAYKTFLFLPVEDYCGLADTRLLKIGYLLLAVFTAAMLGLILWVKKRTWLQILTTGALCALFPLAVNFVVVMCPKAGIYTLMVYGFVMVPCTPLVLLEQLPETKNHLTEVWKRIIVKGIGVVTAMLILLYSYQANVNYTASYYANLQTRDYLSSIITQVRMTEGFDTQKKWAFLGEIQDPLLYDAWSQVPLYRGNARRDGLLNSYSQFSWFINNLGYWYPKANEAEIDILWQLDVVKEMPCWPDAGSIRVIDDMVVIKCQES